MQESGWTGLRQACNDKLFGLQSFSCLMWAGAFTRAYVPALSQRDDGVRAFPSPDISFCEK